MDEKTESNEQWEYLMESMEEAQKELLKISIAREAARDQEGMENDNFIVLDNSWKRGLWNIKVLESLLLQLKGGNNFGSKVISNDKIAAKEDPITLVEIEDKKETKEELTKVVTTWIQQEICYKID